jgi:hypothetical protein
MPEEINYVLCEMCGAEIEEDEAYHYTEAVPICGDLCWERWQAENEE